MLTAFCTFASFTWLNGFAAALAFFGLLNYLIIVFFRGLLGNFIQPLKFCSQQIPYGLRKFIKTRYICI